MKKSSIYFTICQNLCLLLFFCAYILYFIYAFNPPAQSIANISFILIVYVFLYAASILILCHFTKNKKTRLLVSLILLISIVLRVLGSDHQSYDYSFFLHNWILDYKSKSIKNCFISTISNYTPPYNYFLILFSRLPIYDLYLLKALSSIFELLSAVVITLIIAKILKKNFNVWIFAIMWLLPTSLGNSSWWAQCDTIYTFFGLLGLYLALCHKSKSAFLMFGISTAFKMQSIILYPVVLLLLLFKDEETNTKYLQWKDIFMFLVTFIPLTFFPVLIGRPIKEIIGIYLSQTEENARLSGNCPNFSIFIRMIQQNNIATIIPTLITLILTIAYLVVCLVFFIKKYNKNKILPQKDIPLLCLLFTFSIVYFMTRMNDRFFIYSAIFSFICLCIYNDNVLRIGNILNITALTIVMLTDRYYKLCVTGAFINIITIICYTYILFKYFIKRNKPELIVNSHKINQSEKDKEQQKTLQ